MSNIPIVQGVAVPDEQVNAGAGASWFNYSGGQQKHSAAPLQVQQHDQVPNVTLDTGGRPAAEKSFQDVPWAILFLAHLIVMVFLITSGLYNGENGAGLDSGIIFMVSVSGLAAVGVSTCCLSFMMNNTETLVQTSLVFSVACSLVVGILGLMNGSLLMGIMGLLSFAVGICYAWLVWNRIPFAAANLATALTAVRANLGIAVVAYLFTAIAVVWTIFWFLGLGSTISAGNEATWVIFLLFLSYYWVHQVLKNTVHVSTAGVIGTWWFAPDEASTFCGPAVSDSTFRACTYSFGSICFGSLIVAIVQALRALEYQTRDSEDAQIVHCLVQCILMCLESIIEYFNKWAYVYVGLYGFSYLDAGRNVMSLFQQKGWTVVITDDLADNVLFMMSVAIGLATGLLGIVIGAMDQQMFLNMGFESFVGPAFFMTFLTGFLIASILMSVVGSAVNTVIVCFAEAPREFEQNHPSLSARVRAAWTQAWPSLGNI